MPNISPNELNEIWLQAMDTLIKQRLSGLDFDKTSKGRVLKDKGNGLYLIEQDGAIKFDAQAYNDTVYKEGDEVYILIPRNDYSAVKVIIGKSQKGDVQTTTSYVSPLNHMAIVAELHQGMKLNYNGIQANGDVKQLQIGEIDLTALNLKDNYMYTTLGLSVDIKTLFSQLDMNSGGYGIFLRLVMESGAVYDALLDSTEMFGDPYNYMTYFTQSKIFDLAQYNESIAYIGVYLYQDNNFTFWQNEKVERYIPKTMGQQKYDITITNLRIALGDNVIPIADNTFSLSVIGDKDTRYSYSGDVIKTVRATWHNKTKDNEFIGFSDGVVDIAYDEEAYQTAIETQWAGAQTQTNANVAPLRESLQIYQDKETALILLSNIYRYINADINKIVTNLNDYLTKFMLPTNSAIATATESLGFAIQTAINPDTNDATSWHDDYMSYLTAINDIYTTLSNDASSSVTIIDFPARINNDYTRFENDWNLLCSAFIDWFKVLNVTITTENDLHGEVRAYIERQKRLFDSAVPLINTAFTSLKDVVINDAVVQSASLTQRLQNKNLTPFVEEYENFKKNNANKYCIYWYRKDNSDGDEWSGPGWKRIVWDPIPGMPTVDTANNSYTKGSSNLASFQPNANIKEDALKAVLIFNHQKYESNILTFINKTPTADPNTATESDAISIIHGKHSQDLFQKYSSSYTLVSLADAITNRELIVNYKSINSDISSDAALLGATIFWYIPIQATMLAYNSERLKQNGFTELASLLSSLENNHEDFAYYVKYQRNGFACFFKTITNVATDKSFYYLIEKFYRQTANLNTIYCVVEKSGLTYESSIDFKFSQYGTSGTQYTLSVTPVGTAVALGAKIGSPLIVEVNFTGFEGATIENPPAVEAHWLIEGAWNPKIDLMTPTDYSNYGVTPRPGATYFMISRDVDFTLCQYNIFVASVLWNAIDNNALTLSAYYPVAQTKGPYYLTGASIVSYDNMGINPDYERNAYKLFQSNTNAEVKDVTWEIRHYTKTGALQNLNKIEQYLPQLYYEADASVLYPEPGYYLRPIATYVDKLDTYSVILAIQNGQIIYSQPLYLMQNQWDSPLLNAWDEKLTIDKESGIILSTMVGAGFKDDYNKFHGVLMGDVSAKAGISSVKTGIGLYGFHEGAQSFGFNIDGTAFIGKYGNGRIEFNGDKGLITSPHFDASHGLQINVDTGSIYIKGSTGNSTPYFQVTSNTGVNIIKIADSAYFFQSNNYIADNSGMYIDLMKGEIDAHNLFISSKNFILNSLKSTSPYFQLMDDDANVLMKVANKEYYLQTSDFNVDNKTGVRLNLGTGQIDGYKFTLTGYAPDSNSYLSISSKPEIIMHLETDTYNTDMLKINASEFVLQSPDWSNNVEVETEDNVLYATLTGASALNVRTGPGTNFSIVGSVSKGEKKRIYGEELGWYQLDEKGSRYASKKLSNVNVWTESTGSITTTMTKSQGMQFDVRHGSILLQKPNSEQIFSINATAPSYPLQIGSVNKDGQRNFRVGWDGSLYGGSDNSWWIDAKGNAHFNNVTANSGYLGGCQITYVGVQGNAWQLDGEDAIFKSIVMPNSRGENQRLVLSSFVIPENHRLTTDNYGDRGTAFGRMTKVSSYVTVKTDDYGYMTAVNGLTGDPLTNTSFTVVKDIYTDGIYYLHVTPAQTYHYVGYAEIKE